MVYEIEVMAQQVNILTAEGNDRLTAVVVLEIYARENVEVKVNVAQETGGDD